MRVTNRFTLCMIVAALAFEVSITLAQGTKTVRGGGGGTDISYAIVRLAEADGMVTAINNPGHAVGWIETVPGHQAMIWQPGAGGVYVGATLSSTLGIGSEAVTFDSFAQQVSDDGIISGVLGDSQTGLGGWLPVVWLNATSQPKVLPLGTLVFPEAYVEGGAFGVCRTPALQSGLKAVVVGRYVEYPDDVVEGALAIVHAVAWPITTSDELLAPLELAIVNSQAGSEFDTVAIDVNANLQVVGTVASEMDVYKHACRWQLSWNSQTKQLSSDGGTLLFPASQWSSALAINEAGDICGERAGKTRPFLLKRSGSGYVDQVVASPASSKSEYYTLHTARALNGNATPQVICGSTLWTSRGGFVKFADVLWEGSSAWDLEKVTPATEIETDYMTTVNDAGLIGGRGWEPEVQRSPPIILIRQ